MGVSHHEVIHAGDQHHVSVHDRPKNSSIRSWRHSLWPPTHFHFDGGSFDGPKLKGKVLPGGGGGSLIRRDDVMEVDVRLTLETDDNHQIYAAWKGLRHGPKEVMDRLYRGETVDPSAYYFRTTPYFETSSEKYDWMNRICSIASGSLSPNARTLDVFQVL